MSTPRRALNNFPTRSDHSNPIGQPRGLVEMVQIREKDLCDLYNDLICPTGVLLHCCCMLHQTPSDRYSRYILTGGALPYGNMRTKVGPRTILG